MAEAPEIPILDDHVHLDPRGDGVEAVERFARHGGTRIVLVHKPYPTHPVRSADDWADAYEVTLDQAEAVRRRTDVEVLVAVGPHPAEFTRLAEDRPIDEAADVYRAGLDLARDLIADGRAGALGEVGRPHWEVEDPAVAEAADALFVDALERAADVDRPAILHTERSGPKELAEYAAFADEAGLAPTRLVKHYCPPLVEACEAVGVWPSIVADRNDLETALAEGSRFVMETDYMDDPDRPGAVKGIRTVPRRTRALHADGVLDEDAWWRIHDEVPRAIYGDDAWEGA